MAVLNRVYLLVTWKEITLSLDPALFVAIHLYKADTFAAWIRRVLTVYKRKSNNFIHTPSVLTYVHEPDHPNSSAKCSAGTRTTKNPSKVQIHGRAWAQSPPDIYIFVLKCVTSRQKKTRKSRQTLVHVLINAAPTTPSAPQSLQLLPIAVNWQH